LDAAWIEVCVEQTGQHGGNPVRKTLHWKLRSRSFELGSRTLIMGVVNVTPDSFSDGGSFLSPQAAVAHALKLLDQGADILDLGAESTRPGTSGPGRIRSRTVGHGSLVPHLSEPEPAEPEPAGSQGSVSATEEQARLLPVLEAIVKARPEAIVSIDTYKAETAHAALAAKAEIINDVSGFAWDPDLARVCARAGCGIVLMHTRGLPAEWKSQPALSSEALVATVRAGLETSLNTALAAGIRTEAIVLDPGYGFGKRGKENFLLLARQRELLALGRPLLAGLSRKSFLGQALAPLRGGKAAPVDARETASIAALVAAILHGASIVRTHQVASAAEAALIADAIRLQSIDPGSSLLTDPS
jgi:dihydropteroate synthase